VGSRRLLPSSLLRNPAATAAAAPAFTSAAAGAAGASAAPGRPGPGPSGRPLLRYAGSVRYASAAGEVDWLVGQALAGGVRLVSLDLEVGRPGGRGGGGEGGQCVMTWKGSAILVDQGCC
jgi:hypothetical protein